MAWRVCASATCHGVTTTSRSDSVRAGRAMATVVWRGLRRAYLCGIVCVANPPRRCAPRSSAHAGAHHVFAGEGGSALCGTRPSPRCKNKTSLRRVHLVHSQRSHHRPALTHLLPKRQSTGGISGGHARRLAAGGAWQAPSGGILKTRRQRKTVATSSDIVNHEQHISSTQSEREASISI